MTWKKGQSRCDANISVRPVGSKELGTKVEIKNLNTISGVRNGVEYEIRRQTKALEQGETIIQETRRWNPEQKYTTSMRTKEMAHDYRYFPDPGSYAGSGLNQIGFIEFHPNCPKNHLISKKIPIGNEATLLFYFCSLWRSSSL